MVYISLLTPTSILYIPYPQVFVSIIFLTLHWSTSPMASSNSIPPLFLIFPCILLLLSSTVLSQDQLFQDKVVLPAAPSPRVITPATTPPPPTKYRPVKAPQPPSPIPPVLIPPTPAPPVKPPSPSPPVKLPPPTYSPPLPPVKSKKDCIPLCDKRCALHSRKRLCMRACMTCCDRCKCVPPGTFGNRELCGKCYTDMTTHGNRSKCP